MAGFADSIDNVLLHGPSLKENPGSTVALAQGNAPEQDVKAVAASHWARDWKNYLGQLSPEDQSAALNKMNDGKLALLTQTGYKLPDVSQVGKPKEEDGGIWGAIKGAASTVGGALDTAAEATGLKDVSGHAMSALGAPLRAVQHAERAMYLSSQDKSTGAVNPLSKFVRAWDESEHGERTFDPSQTDKLQRETNDPFMYEMAKRVASGDKPEDIFASLDQNQRDIFAGYQTNSKFEHTVNRLEDSKVSPGRIVANGVGISQDSDAFDRVSGAVDATATWFGDPLIIAGKVAKGAKVAKYAVHGEEALGKHQYISRAVFKLLDRGDASADARAITNRIVNQPNIRRYYENAVPYIQTLHNPASTPEQLAEASGMIDRHFGAIKPALGQFIERKVNSVEDIKNSYLNDDSLVHLLSGNAAARTAYFPHMNKAQEAWFKATGGNHGIIDFMQGGAKFRSLIAAGTDPLSPEMAQAIKEGNRTWRGKMATMVSRFGAQVPDLPMGRLGLTNSADDVKAFNSFVRYSAPKAEADALTGMWLGASEAGKRKLFEGAFRTNAEVDGITLSERGNRWVKSHLGTGEDVNYSALGNDVVDPATGRKAALFPYQARPWVDLPDFRQWREMAGKTNILGRVEGVATHRWLDSFMDFAWRPGVLLRPALAVRNAGEEIAVHLLGGGGLGGLAKGRAAARELDKLGVDTIQHTLYDVTVDPLLRKGLINAGGIADKAQAMRAVTSGRLAERVQQAYHGRIVDPEEMRYLQEFAATPNAVQATAQGIYGNAARAASGISDQGYRLAKGLDRKSAPVVASLQGTGKFELRSAESIDGAERWAHQLTNQAKDPLGRIALANIRDRDAAVQQIVAKINAPDFAETRKAMEVAGAKTPEIWAGHIFDEVRHHVSDPQGNLLDDLLRDFVTPAGTSSRGVTTAAKVDAKAISTDRLMQVEDARRPSHVMGQDYIHVSEGTSAWRQFVRWGFDELGNWTSWMSNQPIWIDNYLKTRKQLAPFEKMLLDDGWDAAAAGQHTAERANALAIEKTLQYVDNPAVRSQFSVVARNLFPFWRAQEEFYRRWARVAKFSPEAFRKGQLYMEGAVSSGIIDKDETGALYFVYPGTVAMQAVMSKMRNVLPGEWAMLPVEAGLGGKVKFLNQGLDVSGSNILPSPGPFLAAPLKAFTRLDPAFAPVERAFVGDQGMMESNPVMPFLPTPVRRMINMVQSSEDPNSQHAQAVKSTMANMEALGLAPGPDASLEEIDAYKERVKTWARAHMAVKYIMGLFAPAAPQETGYGADADFAFERQGYAKLSDEYLALMRTLGPEEAQRMWMKMHPDAGAYTVFQSESPSGAFVPATEQAVGWMKKNDAFIHAYPNVAAFFMPQDHGNFDPDAYTVEKANGLRVYKTNDEFYKQLKLNGQLGQYYKAKEAHDAYQKNTPGAAGNGEQDQYNAWKESFLADNPFVADYLSDYGARKRERTEQVDSLRRSLIDERLPAGGPASTIRKMVTAYDRHAMFQDSNAGRDRSSIATRDAEGLQFDTYMQKLGESDPQAMQIYNRVFRYMEG